jgi:hypothetical protein
MEGPQVANGLVSHDRFLIVEFEWGEKTIRPREDNRADNQERAYPNEPGLATEALVRSPNGCGANRRGGVRTGFSDRGDFSCALLGHAKVRI